MPSRPTYSRRSGSDQASDVVVPVNVAMAMNAVVEPAIDRGVDRVAQIRHHQGSAGTAIPATSVRGLASVRCFAQQAPFQSAWRRTALLRRHSSRASRQQCWSNGFMPGNRHRGQSDDIKSNSAFGGEFDEIGKPGRAASRQRGRPSAVPAAISASATIAAARRLVCAVALPPFAGPGMACRRFKTALLAFPICPPALAHDNGQFSNVPEIVRACFKNVKSQRGVPSIM
jgi:hypothetical protein